MTIFDLITNGIVDIGANVISAFVSPYLGSLFSASADWIYDIKSVRDKAEYIAYNWYYLFFI